MKRRNLWILFLLLFLLPAPLTAQDINNYTWSIGRNMLTPRAGAAAAAIDEYIYVAGGLLEDGTIADVVEIYDTENNTWETGTPLPVPLYNTAMAAVDDKLYVMGGYNSPELSVDVTSLWAYDRDTDEWTALADMPSPRAAHVSIVLNGLIYVIGGVGPEPEAVWAYDPETDTWEEDLAPLPTPRESLTAAVLDGEIHAIAGRWEDANIADVEIYLSHTNPPCGCGSGRRVSPSPRAAGGATKPSKF